MAAPDPHWKKKTVPCPFYSQGRCLFSESCNFIHDARITVPQASISAQKTGTDAGLISEADRNEHEPRGQVVKQARRRDGLTSFAFQSTPAKRESLRSPPRSPRMSGLLFALREVIGPDVEENEHSIDEIADNGGQDANDTITSTGDSSSLSCLSDFPSPPFSMGGKFRTHSIDSSATSEGWISPVKPPISPPGFMALPTPQFTLPTSPLLRPYSAHSPASVFASLPILQGASSAGPSSPIFGGRTGGINAAHTATRYPRSSHDDLDSPIGYDEEQRTIPSVQLNYSPSYDNNDGGETSQSAALFLPDNSTPSLTHTANTAITESSEDYDLDGVYGYYSGRLTSESKLSNSPAAGRSKSEDDSIPGSSPSQIDSERTPLASTVQIGRGKVPFGFKRSFTLGQTNASSLIQSRREKGRHGGGNSVSKESLGTDMVARRTNRSPYQHTRTLTSPSVPVSVPQTPYPESNTPSPASATQEKPWMRPLRLSRIFSTPASTGSTSSFISSSASRTRSSSDSYSHMQSRKHSISSIRQGSPHLLQVSESGDSNASSSSSTSASSSSPNYSQASSARYFASSVSSLELCSPHQSHRRSPLRDGIKCTLTLSEEEEEAEDDQSVIEAAGRAQPRVINPPPSHAVATPCPTLLFAIASDSPNRVARLLESGEAHANDDLSALDVEAGNSALAFAVGNDALKNRTEIVKVLLGHGADPSGVLGSGKAQHLDPSMKYYLNRANAPDMRKCVSSLSNFRPISRIRFDLVGQDRALEQLFRVLAVHAQQALSNPNPLVVVCCGPSGHGKSLLARKFGYLLDVPTHTVNMTTLQSTHDLWQSHSMSPYEEPSGLTLAEFLTANEGKRCVVVLDEIEKTENERHLWSLLGPWEIGRCSVGAGQRHIDVRKVIWIGTSNVGQDLVIELDKGEIRREEYLKLMEEVRPRLSGRLGASLCSRVTCVLPFVPFSLEEKRVMAIEALRGLDVAESDIGSLAEQVLNMYVPSEGVRSLQRAAGMVI